MLWCIFIIFDYLKLTQTTEFKTIFNDLPLSVFIVFKKKIYSMIMYIVECMFFIKLMV